MYKWVYGSIYLKTKKTLRTLLIIVCLTRQTRPDNSGCALALGLSTGPQREAERCVTTFNPLQFTKEILLKMNDTKKI